jgi:capsular polysaccharide biosynthesis protein
MEARGLDLVDFLNMLKRRKWFIILGTFISVCLAVGISLYLKPIYEIDTIIQPGKFFKENQVGNIEEIVVERPHQIANKVNHQSFNALIASQLGLDLKKIPKINGEAIPNTFLTRFYIKHHDVELGRKILNSLNSMIKPDIDDKILIELHNLDTQIKNGDIQIETSQKKILDLKDMLKIFGQREKNIKAEISTTKARIAKLEEGQMNALAGQKKSEYDSLSLLLYSNEIQQSFQYYEILDEKLADLKISEVEVNTSIKEEEENISQLEIEILNLEELKGRFDSTQIVKEPTSTVNPIAPNLLLNTAVALFMSLIFFSFFAFVLDFISMNRDLISAKNETS